MHIVQVSTFVLLLALAACAAPVGRKDTRPGTLLSRTVTVHGTERRFAVWVPESYDPTKPSPCVVFLHGAGECGTDGLKQTTVGLAPAAKVDPKQWPCVIVMPQKPTSASEWEEHEEMVLACLDLARHELNIDPRRITLTGLSQGGHGTWIIGARHPELFAALAPVCGYGHPSTLAPRVAGRPVWAFHGGKDDIVPVQESRWLVDATNKLGKQPAARLTIFPEANHNSWDRAYRESGLGTWLMDQRL